MSSSKYKVMEFKMEVIHLNQKQLSTRWNVSEATLERWRCDGIGPKYLKMMSRVLYRLQDIEDFEIASLRESPTSAAAVKSLVPCPAFGHQNMS